MHGGNLDPRFKYQNAIGTQPYSIIMENPFKCSPCGQYYVNLGNLRRHNMGVHQPNTTKYQYWHCPNTYNRKELARRHCLKVHGVTKQQPVKLPCNKLDQSGMAFPPITLFLPTKKLTIENSISTTKVAERLVPVLIL